MFAPKSFFNLLLEVIVDMGVSQSRAARGFRFVVMMVFCILFALLGLSLVP